MLEQAAAAVIEAMPDLMFLIGSDGTIVDWRAGKADDLYVPPEAFLGRTFSEVLPPDVSERLEAGRQRALASGGVELVEYALPMPDGTSDFEARITRYGDDGALVIVRNITDLRRAERRLDALVHGLGAIVWEGDPRTLAFTFVSDGAEAILGYPPERWYAPDFWASILHPDDRERVVQTCQTASAQGRDHELRYRVIAADGRAVWVHDAVSVEVDAEGAPVRSRGVMLDVTAQQQLEEERLHAQKLDSIGLLAGGMAHDFNNLLTSIMASASHLKLRHPELAQPPLILAAAEQGAKLTRQVLAYAGRAPFQVARLDLSQLVRGMADLLRSSVSRALQLRLELADDLPAVEGDRGQLEQVVLNLTVNAADAMAGRHGAVVLATGSRDDDGARQVFLRVTDTGVGMDEVTKARMFDPFFTTKGSGRGLGLAAAAGIARAHHGAIEVCSTPGKGTEVTVSLPAVDGRVERAAPPAPARAPVARTGSGLVLVVDDEPLVRENCRLALTDGGYDVIVANDGAAGVAAFREHADEVCLVVLDVTMPALNGREAFERIRAIRPDVPVLFISGWDEQATARRLPFDDRARFLPKPFRVEQLLERVASLRAQR